MPEPELPPAQAPAFAATLAPRNARRALTWLPTQAGGSQFESFFREGEHEQPQTGNLGDSFCVTFLEI